MGEMGAEFLSVAGAFTLHIRKSCVMRVTVHYSGYLIRHYVSVDSPVYLVAPIDDRYTGIYGTRVIFQTRRRVVVRP